ncbi:MAG: ComEA family DNA-binding protein [Hespellia sp.]|jgi:competence protein ComEA|nr:ComEA family DNA-binding protein [Hespellia sp.]
MDRKRILQYGQILLVSWFLLFGCGQKETLQDVGLEEVDRMEESTAEKEPTEEASQEQGTLETRDSLQPQEIYVYVCGEVQIPGVYVLEADSRVCDALVAAGGMTDVAADTWLNQAQVLTDGEKIYVPSEEEAKELETSSGQDGSGVNQTNAGQVDSEKVSLNRAGKEALMTLPGIGETKAAAILSYREKNGGFRSVEELMQVEGIKEGTYEKLKEYISL